VTVLRHADEHRQVALAETPMLSFFATGRPAAGGLVDLHATFTARET
jgi:hypothetical protein